MGGSSGNYNVNKCGLTELLVFVAAIVSGTACSICSKVMMELHSVGKDGDVETFTKPIFQTFGMFIGMTFGLIMHWVVIWFKIPFPGYTHKQQTTKKDVNGSNGISSHSNGENGHRYGYTEVDPLVRKSGSEGVVSDVEEESPNVPVWMYFFLAIPSVFDLGATALCMCGLRYLDVSIYQMLRGSGIIFVALMKQHVLKDTLHTFQWVGVFWNVVSVVLVGATAMLASNESSKDVEGGEALLGVLLMMAGAFVQAMQFVFEESVMKMDIPAPPLLLIGMEGVWGTALCLLVVYPMVYYLPGEDHGSFEDPFNTWVMIKNSGTIQVAFYIYFFAIFFYNLFAVLVTFLLSSVWHAILDNFRPITVWGTDIFIFYCITAGSFGEPWTRWSFLQLVGMAVLLYGTAIYNAPNAGSLKLEGQWWAFGINLSKEYREIELAEEDAALDAKWEEMQKQFVSRKNSSFMSQSSPFISVHTQALRGLGSPKI